MSDHSHAPADQTADARGHVRSVARPTMSQGQTAHRLAGQRQAAAPDAGEAWDAASAEALMQVYEGHEPTVYYADPPQAPAAFGRRAQAPTPAAYAMPSALPVGVPAAAPPTPRAQQPAFVETPVAPVHAAAIPQPTLADLAQDRAWLDGRFSDLAARLEETMKRLDPAEHIAPLANRLEDLEGHMRSALDDVVRKDAFAGLETQIGDVRKQLETARQKLERLDGIENKLGELASFAEAAQDMPQPNLPRAADFDIEAIVAEAVDRAAERLAQQAHQPAPALNMDELADRTASRTAERMAAAPMRTAMPEGMGELRALVSGYVDEYRREQSQTSAALATMQEALVQLIDRIDQYDEDQNGGGHDDQSGANPAPASSAPLTAGPRDRFVEVSDERGGRPGRRASDGIEPTLPTPSSMAAAMPEPRGAAHHPVHHDEPVMPRAPRRPTGVPAATVDTDAAAAAAAMASERARLATERTSQTASARPSPRVAHPQSAPADQAQAAGPTTGDADLGATGPKARAPRKAAAASSSVAKRGLMVGGLAILVIGASFFAHMFMSGRIGAPKMEDRVPTASSSQSTGPKLTPRPQAQSVTIAPPERANPDQLRGNMPLPVPTSAGPAPAPAMVPPVGPIPAQPATQRGPQLQPSPQQQPAPQAQPSTNALPDAFKPKSVPETINEDLQSNVRPQGMPAAVPAAVSGISVDNGQLPNAAELARRMATPNAAAVTAPSAPSGAQPISTAPLAETPPATEGLARGPVEMPPAAVGPMSLRAAAQQGEPGAQFEVAARFAEGKGIKQDFQQAISWYSRASQKGFVPAQYRLATLYERGLGTPADITRAKVWYRRAADQGNVKSMHNLAVLAAGPQQAEPDYATASRWFTEAAERGLADSQFNLGVLTENGLGMAKDQMQAYKWFALAARSGDKEAARRRDQLGATFTPEQARSAEALVSGWRAKPMEMKANDPRAATQAYAAEREAATQAAARQIEQRQFDQMRQAEFQQRQAEQQKQAQQAAPIPPTSPPGVTPKPKPVKVTRQP
jgi:localization factor PodJL